MAKSLYTPRSFLRNVPAEFLRRYFKTQKVLTDFDWARFDETNIEPLFEAWEALPEPARRQIESHFRQVDDLATEMGVAALAHEVKYAGGQEAADALSAIDGFHAKGLWVLCRDLEEDPTGDIFECATLLNRADKLNGKYWKRRIGLSKKRPDIAPKTREELGKAISAYYRREEGRGVRCKVELLLRDGHVHYFFAYPEDFADLFIGYDREGNFARRLQQPAFEVVFIFDEIAGTLNLWAPGRRETKVELEEIFGRVILHEELGDEKEKKPYELNGLKNRNFRFTTDPADGIGSVRVKRLRLAIMGGRKRSITLESDVGSSRFAVYDLLDHAINSKNVPLSNVNVTHARIQIVFDRPADRWKSLTFNVSYPEGCDLHDKPQHVLARKYLERWGIARV